MGTYLSIPYVSRKVVQLEQGKPVMEAHTEVAAHTEVKEKAAEETPSSEEVTVIKDENEVPKEEKKEDKKEATKELVDFPPVNLSIVIPTEPSHEEIAAEPPKGPVARIPEFQSNMNSESHAIKKFNRRHRKH